VSFFQRLFHTFSLYGRKYEASQWNSTLGLPDPEGLNGLEMEVKSIFVLPFSVMHPKFVIVDRMKVFLPSCNVSWENWFEGCITLRGNKQGQIVSQFLQFWQQFWARGEALGQDANGNDFETEETDVGTRTRPEFSTKPESCWWSMNHLQQNRGWTPSLFLPSPHHQNPRFSLLPWRPCPPPPPTPLNTFLLSAFGNAKRYIYIQTPNLTSPPVLSALLHALDLGVNVTIVTSERLMILEQLVTAGTTTKRCLNKLVKRHRRLLQKRKSPDWTGIEDGVVRPGRLQVYFFQPDSSKTTIGSSETTPEPTQSHLKLINIDDEWTIFGSGNMDRASWYTSQELGVAFWSQQSGEQPTEIAQDVRGFLDTVMHGRKKLFYDGRVDQVDGSRSNSFNHSTA
jgi:phosphatidylserine/phosphatidylglycerophosphate/cardiolipin synthase-like enzyme